ncbi:uncharacterized protein [Henckelia pumila]|uniref:uncharacterized protein n=1 Tax=Henckelia pumila TaxID=405737 RepID=UPI003C6E3458
MISGGSTDGDSNRARKSWSRRESLGVDERRQGSGPIITFGPRDLEEVNFPHNDVLLIQAMIANYDVRRVSVDSGSSVNILFQEAFEQMDLQGYELSPVKIALYGFAGHTVQPRGEILLPITLGSGDERKIVMTRFTLVESPSSYNVILGRPTMNAFRAVASTYHQKIKFPVGDKRARRIGKEEGQGGREVCSVEESKGEYEEVELVLGKPGKSVMFARDLEANLVERLKSFLIQNKDVFAWVQGDLMGVSSQVAEHKLNITPGSRPGYHQIPLALEDHDKVSFITSGGATYQRMMDKVFREKMGRNVEVYVDDILVKSRTRDCFIPDLEETFATVRRYGIKLNPAKCMFGVKSGKFLGFMVTERGIEVNPEKVKLL